ncbi:PREDICTED: WD repeat-containing protein 93 [Gekko japonicus]|uniref:WD repeat-containing protein 93 n=1 Tax=Gekko japonicus TaxID=146911 RepID=A0ABM1KLZ2_GEKJA|nr:PREDICTED: WD repeat-containing protein 93 [Gekko japonicus]
MPFYLRKLPLEIPPPTEKEWIKKDEGEAFFLKDPDQIIDYLPQPFQMVNKLVTVLFERAWEIIEGREQGHVMKKQHPPPTRYWPSAEFQKDGVRDQCRKQGLCLKCSLAVHFAASCPGVGTQGAVKKALEKRWVDTPTKKTPIKPKNQKTLQASVPEENPDLSSEEEDQPHVYLLKLLQHVFQLHTLPWKIISNRGSQFVSKFWGELLKLLGVERGLSSTYHPETDGQMERVVGRANCLAASREYIFIGLSTGLSVFSIATCEKIGAWETARLEICTLHASDLDNNSQVLGTVDEMGFAHLLYFSKENLLHVKAINEVEDISKRNTCVRLELSHRGDYAGFLLQGNLEAWLEIYRLPKDSWQKEAEHVQTSALTAPVLNSVPASFRDRKLSTATVVQNIHVHAMFHFHGPGRTLPFGMENKSEPDTPVALSLHWSASHNLCFYLLSRPPKEKADSDPKPDIIWPCAAPIALSSVTPCSSHLAFVCEDGTITVWDKSLGFPLFVTMLPDKYVVRSIQFMPCCLLPRNKALSSSKYPACTKVQLLVLCADGSLHLMTSRAKEFSTKILVYKPEDPRQAISATATVPSLTNAVLTCSWGGTVSLMDTATEATVCYFITPPPYRVTTPWHPVFAVDTDGRYLFLQGYEQSGSMKAETGSNRSTIFLFDIPSRSETSLQDDEYPPDSLENMPWDRRCDVFLNNSMQQPSAISQQMPECWSQLQMYVATLQGEAQEK